MMQFSGKTIYNTDSSQHNRVRSNYENSPDNSWKVSSPGQQLPDQTLVAPQPTRTSPSHKPPQQTFLIWVAFTRSFAPNIHQIERRTCPLIGCEECFDTLEDMLEHVKECPRLSKGLYRCFESGKEERIGRCESPRCQELQQCKDRIVNSLKRRLSPRGQGPRRQPGIPLEMQSLSPEMNAGLDKMFPIGVAELSSDSSISPPAYTPRYFNPIQGSHAELDSTFSVPYQFAELESGQAHGGLMQFERAELASDEDQHYQYGIAELGADNSFSYEENYQTMPHHEQPYSYQLGVSNSQDDTDDWNQSISVSGSPVAQDKYNDFGYLLEEKTNWVTSPIAHDLNKPEYIVSGYGNPTGYYVPPMGRGGSTSNSWHTSDFSRVSRLSSGDTSISSWGPDKVAVPTPPGTDNSLLDDSARMFSEPDEIEPLQTLSTELRDEYLNGAGSWDTRPAIDTPLKGFHSVPSSYTSGLMLRDGTPSQDQFQISRKPVPLSMPGTEPRPPTFCPEIKYSPRHQLSTSSSSSYRNEVNFRATDECIHCGRSIPDKSNLKRHEWNCKKNPVKADKRYTCRFPDCGKRYTRSDALKVHQNNKGHQGFIDIYF